MRCAALKSLYDRGPRLTKAEALTLELEVFASRRLSPETIESRHASLIDRNRAPADPQRWKKPRRKRSPIRRMKRTRVRRTLTIASRSVRSLTDHPKTGGARWRSPEWRTWR